MSSKPRNKEMTAYVAFLRGINVGGANLISMADLRDLFESMEFENVRTVLATGNVVFESGKVKPRRLADKIEKQLAGALDKKIGVTVRSVGDLVALAGTSVFRSAASTKGTKFYVSFFREPRPRKVPVTMTRDERGFDFVYSSRNEVCTAVDLALAGTPDLMAYLDRVFGRDVTTRTRETINRVLKAAGR